VAGIGIVSGGVGLCAEEVERQSCELKMTTSAEEPDLVIVGDVQKFPKIVSGLLDDFSELLGVGVDIEEGLF
jgi:hypothetical protein